MNPPCLISPRFFGFRKLACIVVILTCGCAVTGCSNNAPAPLTEAQMQADIEKVQSNTKMSQVEKEHTIEIIRAAGKEKTSP